VADRRKCSVRIGKIYLFSSKAIRSLESAGRLRKRSTKTELFTFLFLSISQSRTGTLSRQKCLEEYSRPSCWFGCFRTRIRILGAEIDCYLNRSVYAKKPMLFYIKIYIARRFPMMIGLLYRSAFSYRAFGLVWVGAGFRRMRSQSAALGCRRFSARACLKL